MLKKTCVCNSRILDVTFRGALEKCTFYHGVKKGAELRSN